jgi:hypothetical protein
MKELLILILLRLFDERTKDWIQKGSIRESENGINEPFLTIIWIFFFQLKIYKSFFCVWLSFFFHSLTKGSKIKVLSHDLEEYFSWALGLTYKLEAFHGVSFHDNFRKIILVDLERTYFMKTFWWNFLLGLIFFLKILKSKNFRFVRLMYKIWHDL